MLKDKSPLEMQTVPKRQKPVTSQLERKLPVEGRLPQEKGETAINDYTDGVEEDDAEESDPLGRSASTLHMSNHGKDPRYDGQSASPVSIQRKKKSIPLKNITIEGACLNSSVSDTNRSPRETKPDNDYTFRPPTRESHILRKSRSDSLNKRPLDVNMPRGLSNADRYIEISKKRQRALENMLYEEK